MGTASFVSPMLSAAMASALPQARGVLSHAMQAYFLAGVYACLAMTAALVASVLTAKASCVTPMLSAAVESALSKAQGVPKRAIQV